MKLILAVTLGLATQLAAADPIDKPKGKVEFAEGKKLYANQDYLGAAQRFTAAYRADPDPAYIFNVGQAYRRRAEQKSSTHDNDCWRSLEAYRRFLVQVPEAPNKKEVDAYIKEMETCAGALLANPPASELPPIDRPVDKPPIDKPPIDKPPIDKPPIDKPPPGPGRDPKQLVGLGVGVVGLIFTGIGVYYLNEGRRITNDRDPKVEEYNALPLDQREMMEGMVLLSQIDALDGQGKRADKRATITLITGGALVAGGVALFILGRSPTTEQRLVVAPTREGAMVLGTFRF